MKYGEESIAKAELELWPNVFIDKNYEIKIDFPEFTCLCPRSGYPDFATIKITYIPNEKIVELKSFKLFLNSFRQRYISHEESTNIIYNELYEKLTPRYLEVIGDFNPRGNVKTVIRISSEDNPKK
ncbi:MAG: preQ(1) synthase [Candidatus Magnetoovum sp. WYHC-5]|nr:preQ(1) synthase [Candidatus Magnetoovum sp. WYHC-5]